jgi:hypothetical protein
VADTVQDWSALRAKVAGALIVTGERASGFAAKTADGYPLLIEHAPGNAIEWLVVRVPVCKQGEMDPERVLERNGTLAFATLLLM